MGGLRDKFRDYPLQYGFSLLLALVLAGLLINKLVSDDPEPVTVLTTTTTTVATAPSVSGDMVTAQEGRQAALKLERNGSSHGSSRSLDSLRSAPSGAPEAEDALAGQDAGAEESADVQDAEAKSIAKTVHTVLEVYAVDNNGSYSGATLDDLQLVEPSIPDAVSVDVGTGNYVITVESDSGNLFFLERFTTGELSYMCQLAGEGGCPSSGEWS